jgi:hypothetical protein
MNIEEFLSFPTVIYISQLYNGYLHFSAFQRLFTLPETTNGLRVMNFLNISQAAVSQSRLTGATWEIYIFNHGDILIPENLQ